MATHLDKEKQGLLKRAYKVDFEKYYPMAKWIFTFQFAHIAKNSEFKRSNYNTYLQIEILWQKKITTKSLD